MIPHATRIPRLLIAVHHYWPTDGGKWPNWPLICSPNVEDLQEHEWWPRVVWNGAKDQMGGSAQSILGKRKAEKSAERDLEKGRLEEEMEIDEVPDEEARRKEKVEGKRKAQSNDQHDNDGDNVERGRSRQRQRLEGPPSHPKLSQRPKSILRSARATEKAPTISTPQQQDQANDNTYNPPCSECQKKMVPCYKTATGLACQRCKVVKRKCDRAEGQRGHAASRHTSRAPSRAPAGSRAQGEGTTTMNTRSPSPGMMVTRGRSQSRPRPASLTNCKYLFPISLSPLTTYVSVAEVVITSRPPRRVKAARSHSTRSISPSTTGPFLQTEPPHISSPSARGRPVPPASIPTTSPNADLSPGRSHVLAGVPMVSKAEFEHISAELETLRSTMERVVGEQQAQVDLLKHWAEQYQGMRGVIRELEGQRAALREDVRDLQAGYTAMGQVMERVRSEVGGAPTSQATGLELAFAFVETQTDPLVISSKPPPTSQALPIPTDSSPETRRSPLPPPQVSGSEAAPAPVPAQPDVHVNPSTMPPIAPTPPLPMSCSPTHGGPSFPPIITPVPPAAHHSSPISQCLPAAALRPATPITAPATTSPCSPQGATIPPLPTPVTPNGPANSLPAAMPHALRTATPPAPLQSPPANSACLSAALPPIVGPSNSSPHSHSSQRAASLPPIMTLSGTEQSEDVRTGDKISENDENDGVE